MPRFEKPPYYITAYGLAVKRGYKGTLDEWLASLQGTPGDAATLVSSAVEYLVSDSGTVIPSGSWTTTIPTVAQGKYLWTRTTQTYNTGDPIISYSISRMGLDGASSVVTVNLVSPDADGNVALKAADIGAVATDGSSTMTGPLDMGSNRVKNVADPEEDADAVNKRYADKFLLKGEAATSANKLNIDAGSATNPVYFADGVPVKTTHTLESSVPADAKFTDTVYVHPAYTERTGVPTANATPAFGGTFKVSQPVTDDTGHVTAINSRTVTIPSTTATASAAGLMSASDYSKLNTLCPKMAVGTEYKTGEYYAGYAVYAKIVNGGALPNNTYTTVSTGITNGMHLVSIDVCFGSGGTFQNIMPVEQNASGYSVKIRQAAITRVILQTGGDETGSTCYILLKYTKTTG